jgi:hypothetical protein
MKPYVKVIIEIGDGITESVNSLTWYQEKGHSFPEPADVADNLIESLGMDLPGRENKKHEHELAWRDRAIKAKNDKINSQFKELDICKETIQGLEERFVLSKAGNLCPGCNKNPIAPNRDGCCVACSH